MASPKQVNFILHLLAENGYSTRFMNASFKALGATMRQRSGSVEAWLRSKNTAEASELIDRLKASKPYKTETDPEVQALKGVDAETAELRRMAGLEGQS